MPEIRRRMGGPRPGDATLTVGEVAQALAPIAPNVAATVQRLRHWTREQMLVPAEQIHAGTGRHRQYDADAVYDAAVLHAATNAGLNISSQRHLIDALSQVRFALPNWKLAVSRGAYAPLYLHIWRTTTGATTSEISENQYNGPSDKRGFKSDDVITTIQIDLGKLFAKVRPHGRS